MKKRTSNPDFLNGVPEMLICRLLEEKEMHGYEIVKTLKEVSDTSFSFGEGCIYPVLHQMEKNKYIKGKKITIKGRSRIVYSLTQLGKERKVFTVSRWKEISNTIKNILDHQANEKKIITSH